MQKECGFMENKIDDFISQGYKILAFERDIDKVTGEETGKIEIKALDGHRRYITFDDNAADEVERVLFEYLRNKEEE
ncbi:hypothetical protein LGK97_01390 [Clostridium sp. CS001]|uniref:hypothetical protein n=1 Tax=Clostridium sp. CS001 TaxID=2880648 RepID=UPI001CF3501E|nr:hypothetical protein [Clostridium sp. CS001]MCB2288420.1 hypothetical protein [Clostridium sp. CS001]